MVLFMGSTFALGAFMDELEIVPPPDPVPIPTPAQQLNEDEDELMLIGSIGFHNTFAGSGSADFTVPRTTDASNNTSRRSRYDACQIDVELSAAGYVSVQWDTQAATDKIYIITGRRQLLAVPSGATTLTVTAPGAGEVTVTFGRTES